MPDVLTRADALREYLTGATVDGGMQADPALSVGNYRSATEVVSYGITLFDAINNLTVDYASGSCAEGDGTLTCVNANTINWQDASSDGPGPALILVLNGSTGIVEGKDPASYLRVTRGVGTFSGGPCTVNLTTLLNNVIGMDDVTYEQTVSGLSLYHGTMLRNEGTLNIGNIQRYISLLGTQRLSNVAQLAGSGPGTLQTGSNFNDWPDCGWCQIRSSGLGQLREIVYYSSRTNTVLNVLTSGRGRLGTVAQAGSPSDTLYPVPGIAIALDVNGIQNSGQPMVNSGGQAFAPPGVVWNKGITSNSGLQIGTLVPGKEIGIWIWRETPVGATACPGLVNKITTVFQSA